jgi:formyl-CoA transferase
MIAAGNDAIFQRLCTAIDLPRLAQDGRFATNPLRVEHRDVLDPIVEARTSELSSAELLERLREASVPASAIQSIADVVADPQVEAAGMLGSSPHPDVPDYRDVSLPLRMEGARPAGATAPPAPGAHTEEVLLEIGYAPEEIERLKADGALG